MIRLAALLTILASPALALQCAPRDKMASDLAGLGEAPVGMGLALGQAGGGIVETWVSEETGTWTVLLSGPTGMSCILVHGSDWQAMVPVKGDPA